MKRAIITGVSGQDGSYLAELLLEKGYEVIGLKRRTSTYTLGRVSHIKSPHFSIVEYEISDAASVYSIVDEYRPDEIYNFAAQSHVKTSFEQPDYTFQTNTIGVINFLEAIRRFSPDTRFYQASTSEMFGKTFDVHPCDCRDGETCNHRYQDEETYFAPQSPYAAAKLASHNLVGMYREGYGLHASCGILFNHESERRGEEFVTRKITKWVAEFKTWLNSMCEFADLLAFDDDFIYCNQNKFAKLRLGNLDAYRDWGHSKDYVYATWLMLQQEYPDDYVIATGKTYSVRDFLKEAFGYIGIEDYPEFITIDPLFYRPAEVDYLRGLPDKAKNTLGWEPKITFKELVQGMLESDVNVEKEKKDSKRKAIF